jgi:hypothetical protein
MATQLFKGNEAIWIQPQDIQNHLDIGWSLDDPNKPKVLPAGIEIINPKTETAPPEIPRAIEASQPKKRGRKPKGK